MIILYPRLKTFSTTYRDTASILGVTVGVVLSGATSSGLFQVPEEAPLYDYSLYGMLLRSVVGVLVVAIFHECSKRAIWLVVVFFHKRFVGDKYKPYPNTKPYVRHSEKRYSVIIPHKFFSYIAIGWVTLAIISPIHYTIGVSTIGWPQCLAK